MARSPSSGSGWLGSVLSLAFAGALLYNFMSDEPHVERMAVEAACAGRPAGCTAQARRTERTPFGRSWDYSVGPDTLVHVTCRRAYILVGDYSCASAL